MLIDLPRGVAVGEFLAEVAKTSGAPARRLALTHFDEGDAAIVESLLAAGVTQVISTESARERLLAAAVAIAPAAVKSVTEPGPIDESRQAVEFVPFDAVACPAGAAVYLPKARVLFAGPLVVNGPRVRLPGSDTARWIEALTATRSAAGRVGRARLWFVGRRTTSWLASAGS